MSTSRRPFAVTFTVLWAVALSGMLLARAAGQTAVPRVVPGALSPLATLAVQVLLALLVFVAAATLFKLVSWSRRLGMVAFLVAAAVSAPVAVGGSLFGFVLVAMDVSSLTVLAMHADAFTSDRPDIDDSGSATHFGTR